MHETPHLYTSGFRRCHQWIVGLKNKRLYKHTNCHMTRVGIVYVKLYDIGHWTEYIRIAASWLCGCLGWNLRHNYAGVTSFAYRHHLAAHMQRSCCYFGSFQLDSCTVAHTTHFIQSSLRPPTSIHLPLTAFHAHKMIRKCMNYDPWTMAWAMSD